MSSTVADASPSVDYLDVTELAGDPISTEQLERMRHRYAWAISECHANDVAELACGTGPGLGMLAREATSLAASDFSQAMVERVRAHYGGRVELASCDATAMFYPANSKDVIILFEALYYLRDVAAFFRECRRVLRRGGIVLISTANKDLVDFNPSPHSHRYLGVVELAAELSAAGFQVECFGYLDTREVSLRQRVLRPIKRLVVNLGLMPKTMRGKKLLKRLVFGQPVTMPAELDLHEYDFVAPAELSTNRPDRFHKVIYCKAVLGETHVVS